MMKMFINFRRAIRGTVLAAAIFGWSAAAAGCTLPVREVLTVSAQESRVSEEPVSGNTPVTVSVSEEEAEADSICVFVCGAVHRPGVYRLPADARACDALEAAEGFADDADPSYVNLASPLTDGQKLEFPTKEEAERLREGGRTGGASGPDGTPLVNINTADASQLETLPGIGGTKAGAIIAYREECGGFSDVEDLKNVPGIGETSFERLRDRITVGGP